MAIMYNLPFEVRCKILGMSVVRSLSNLDTEKSLESSFVCSLCYCRHSL